jgi:hypothetical protein
MRRIRNTQPSPHPSPGSFEQDRITREALGE